MIIGTMLSGWRFWRVVEGYGRVVGERDCLTGDSRPYHSIIGLYGNLPYITIEIFSIE